MKREYEVVYQEIEDGWFMATAPDLPGAVTQGRDLAEVQANILEAIELVTQCDRELTRRKLTTRLIRGTLPLEVGMVWNDSFSFTSFARTLERLIEMTRLGSTSPLLTGNSLDLHRFEMRVT